MGNKKVFIVEDDIVVLSGLQAKFGHLGMETISSTGDEEMSQIIKNLIIEKADFVVLDLILPKIDGFKLLRIIKEEVPRVPVFVFSDLSEKDIEERCRFLGADYYYLKQDFNTGEFAEKVNKILKNRDKIKI